MSAHNRHFIPGSLAAHGNTLWVCERTRPLLMCVTRRRHLDPVPFPAHIRGFEPVGYKERTLYADECGCWVSSQDGRAHIAPDGTVTPLTERDAFPTRRENTRWSISRQREVNRYTYMRNDRVQWAEAPVFPKDHVELPSTRQLFGTCVLIPVDPADCVGDPIVWAFVERNRIRRENASPNLQTGSPGSEQRSNVQPGDCDVTVNRLGAGTGLGCLIAHVGQLVDAVVRRDRWAMARRATGPLLEELLPGAYDDHFGAQSDSYDSVYVDGAPVVLVDEGLAVVVAPVTKRHTDSVVALTALLVQWRRADRRSWFVASLTQNAMLENAFQKRVQREEFAIDADLDIIAAHGPLDGLERRRKAVSPFLSWAATCPRRTHW